MKLTKEKFDQIKLNNDLINDIKRYADKKFSGVEATVYLNGDLALKEYSLAGINAYASPVGENPNEIAEEYNKMLEHYLKTINSLADGENCKINTPHILDYLVVNNNNNMQPYLLMERAKGKPLAAMHIETLEEFIPKAKGVWKDYRNLRFLYYKQIIEELTDAPDKHYNKFVGDIKTVLMTPQVTLDPFSENFCYDKNNKNNGFSLLDLGVCFDDKIIKSRVDIYLEKYLCEYSLRHLEDLKLGCSDVVGEANSRKMLSNCFDKATNALRQNGVSNNEIELCCLNSNLKTFL